MRRTLALLLGLLVSACSGDDGSDTPTGPAPTISSVAVVPAATTLASLGATATLAATATLTNGSAATATVTWSSSDQGVATVGTDGTVTAVADGTATITAQASSSSGSGSGTAQVTVAQVAATLSVTPTADTIVSGRTVLLAATATDAGGSAIMRRPTWTSSDEAIATVDGLGLVRGVGGGTVDITATLNDLSDVATIVVELEDLAPPADTTLSGTMEVNSFSVPAGVTVTVDGDFSLTSQAPIIIDGTITGGCGAISMVSSDTVRITGTLSTVCESPDDGEGDIVIDGAGWSVEGATISVAGLFQVGPDSLPSAAPAGAAGSSGARLRALDKPCVVADPLVTAGNLYFSCYDGPLTLSGIDVTMADGGGGDNVTGVGEVRAEGGGSANMVRFEAMGTVTVTTGLGGPNIVRVGSGGAGGRATAAGPSPLALGGWGGDAGGFTVRSRQDVIIAGAFTVILGQGGDGGTATAVGDDGAHAGEGRAAEDGSPASARGGQGGGYDFRRSGTGDGQTQSFGHLFSAAGSVSGLANVTLTTSRAGHGGRAVVRPGVGGNGNEAFPNGANGGIGTAEGGKGGEYVVMLQDGSPDLAIGGDGGDAHGTFGNGGAGWSDCVVGSLQAGGNGGSGGSFSFLRGAGGVGGASNGTIGNHTATDAGNGGAAGRGVGPGAAGTGSTPIESATPTSNVFTNSFANGVPASGCAVIHETSVSVLDDPSGHEPFIGMTGVTSVTVELGANNTITLTGDAPWITVTGTLNADGTFALAGNGTAAGNAGTDVTFTGSVGLDSTGRIASVTGTLSVGTNGNLPTGKPADYTVSTTAEG